MLDPSELNATVADTPFEQQLNPCCCGAAALAMVYRSLALDAVQDDVWKRIVELQDGYAGGSRVRSLCQEARTQGFEALAIRALHPWKLLQRCQEYDIAAILNYRMEPRGFRGHCGVLTGVSDDKCWIHDPTHGPHREFSRQSLLEVWRALGVSAITGETLVVIARPTDDARTCSLCQAEIPARYRCSLCLRHITVGPRAALGCAVSGCPERLWRYVYCPHCDEETDQLKIDKC